MVGGCARNKMKTLKANKFILVLIIILAVVSGFFVYPKGFGQKFLPWRLGLDLIGGSALTYEVDLSGVDKKDYGNIISGLKEVIEKRVNLYGVAEPKVVTAQKGDSYQLLIELAGIKDLKDAVKQIGETPILEFREVKETKEKNKDGKEETLQNFIPTQLTGRHIKNTSLVFNDLGQPIFTFELNDDGAKIFEDVTARNTNNPLCIFVDGNFIFSEDPQGSCPIVQGKISGGKAQISGGGINVEVAKKLIERFNAGALSAPIKLINQRTVAATAASDALNKIIMAGLIGTGLVMLFMIIYYHLYGFFAALALIIYIVVTLAVFKLIPNFTMSLAGIAGFILSIGMAVDANILIFERTKEEMKKGLTKVAAIEEGFKRAWSSIRDSNISTIITSVILYYFTSSFVKGFALTLGLGVIVSMFSAIFATRSILKTFVKE